MKSFWRLCAQVMAGLAFCVFLTGLAPVSFTRSPEEELRQKAAQDFLRAHRDFEAAQAIDEKGPALKRAMQAAKLLLWQGKKDHPIVLLPQMERDLTVYKIYSVHGSVLMQSGFLRPFRTGSGERELMPGFYIESGNPASEYYAWEEITGRHRLDMLTTSPDVWERLAAIWAMEKMGHKALHPANLLWSMLLEEQKTYSFLYHEILRTLQAILASEKMQSLYREAVEAAHRERLLQAAA